MVKHQNRSGKGGAGAIKEEIFKVPDLAKYLRCARITVYRHAEKGNLPAHRFGGQWRFYRDEIDRWLRARKR